MRAQCLFAWLCTVGCAGATSAPPTANTPAPAVPTAAGETTTPAIEPVASTAPVPDAGPRPEGEARCEEPIPVYADGSARGEVCPEHLAARGLTVLSLANDFAPHAFDEAPELGELGIPPYRATYLALADERWDDLPEEVDAERFLELFGIVPTPRVLVARLRDTARHECHAAIPDEDVLGYEGTLRTWQTREDEQRARLRRVIAGTRRFEQERLRLGLASIDDLGGQTRSAASFASYLADRAVDRSVRAMQAHLACDGLWTRRGHEPGVFETRNAVALGMFQRQHLVVSGGTIYDAATREALTRDSRESDFRAVLRMLRERVVDATGLLEDGSAVQRWGTVLGRTLDPRAMQTLTGAAPAEGGAEDAISPATEAAARALGWVSPEGFLAFYEHDVPRRVAVALPPPPAYHAARMDLRAEIDRGDVWYDYPYTEAGVRRGQPIERRPTLTLYARTPSGDVALVRWSTTIGGWKTELDAEGELGLRYKESPAGPRIWRDIIVSPAWMPPPGTPERGLVRRGRRGRYVQNADIFGPGYRSAYGLGMVMHHVPDASAEGGVVDQGVRSHGSVSYGSIQRGTSHGCHRLYNHLAVRLLSFLLLHREHVRRGSIPAHYRRTVVVEEESVELEVDSRGYLYELTPPVEVVVLPGTIRGHSRRADETFRPLPERARADALAMSADD